MLESNANENDYLFDTGSASGVAYIIGTTPGVVTQDSTIIVGGKIRFKAPIVIPCPRCQRNLRPGRTTIEFQHAPTDQRSQQVDGWICECGETYVPGSNAKHAFERAMSDDECDQGQDVCDKRLLTVRELGSISAKMARSIEITWEDGDWDEEKLRTERIQFDAVPGELAASNIDDNFEMTVLRDPGTFELQQITHVKRIQPWPVATVGELENWCRSLPVVTEA